MHNNKRNIRIQLLLRFIIFIIAVIWFTGLISPCIKNNFLHSFYPYLKLGYSTVCHQNVDKSFTCENGTFLVCARCTGIYMGVLISSLIILIPQITIKIKTWQLILFSLPMLADVIFYSIGLYQYNKIIAAITGILFGSAVFLYILGAIENSLYTKIKTHK